MRNLFVAGAASAALLAAEPAGAGCWATAEVSPPPKRVASADTWPASVTVLQHGRNPLPDAATARPTLTIRNAATGEKRTFVATPTAKPGVYEARVVFPSAGTWDYEVFDDFTTWGGAKAPCASTHELGTVEIGGAANASATPPSTPARGPSTASGGFPESRVLAVAALALVALLGLGAGLRRRRAAAAPATR